MKYLLLIIFFPDINNPKKFWTGLNACYYKLVNKMIEKRLKELDELEVWLKKDQCIQR